ncbi:MAG: hypothetical protein JWR89_5145, partial [Tardiphaga sp.]|uniref:hypothetical protein n=1 Tax=Tardiphaga sp. TaxID=1926292 RepID=UPI00262C100E
MIRFLAAVLLCALLAMPAEAKQRRSVACVETGTIMAPQCEMVPAADVWAYLRRAARQVHSSDNETGASIDPEAPPAGCWIFMPHITRRLRICSSSRQVSTSKSSDERRSRRAS